MDADPADRPAWYLLHRLPCSELLGKRHGGIGRLHHLRSVRRFGSGLVPASWGLRTVGDTTLALCAGSVDDGQSGHQAGKVTQLHGGHDPQPFTDIDLNGTVDYYNITEDQRYRASPIRTPRSQLRSTERHPGGLYGHLRCARSAASSSVPCVQSWWARRMSTRQSCKNERLRRQRPLRYGSVGWRSLDFGSGLDADHGVPVLTDAGHHAQLCGNAGALHPVVGRRHAARQGIVGEHAYVR